MRIPKIPLAQTVIKLCELKQIKHIVISPGSRNAPLTIGFTNHPYFKCYSIVDERCAAFFALGIAQQLQEPVAVVCTSGSALLNYYPAVAEAYYSDIPLVVLSADRPKHLIGIGDGQTINQKGVYKNHILFEANLNEDSNTAYDATLKIETANNEIQEQNEIAINKAINIAWIQKGPVHINVPFNEPLYTLVDNFSVSPKNFENKPCNAPVSFEHYKNVWMSSKKKMILVGVNAPNSIEQYVLEQLAEDPSVLVFTETTSNLHHSSFFPSIDKIIGPLEPSDFEELQPEILLTFGGLIVSKKIKAFLRTYKPKHHWHVDEKKANDTFFCLDQHIKSSPNSFLKEMVQQYTESSYKSFWTKIKSYRFKKHKNYLENLAFSDFVAFKLLLEAIPNNTQIQCANSSTIRYLQLFDLNPTLSLFCNRGTSGIDGSTSTAIGASVVANDPVVCITGDLSFLYDSNALWNTHIPSNFKIIVINNGGGGIFRILPGHKNTDNFDTYFETQHQHTAENLCKMYRFDYVSASSEASLKASLAHFFKESSQPRLLEIFTPTQLNDVVLLNYFKAIK
ncbi:MAG: 2-succinyl-5-enolpyruvyl-6-hydroxy-3-cyclohexene-1-carboxylic-acid synthase [Flavobacteriaceae bacterium]|nr:2-succinyl-5-enolpyruvyl-6-hydroxy-3-cyclohexene-1-carboxylic-acid synthase [Flavobacteriaceae bacterium]